MLFKGCFYQAGILGQNGCLSGISVKFNLEHLEVEPLPGFIGSVGLEIGKKLKGTYRNALIY